MFKKKVFPVSAKKIRFSYQDTVILKDISMNLKKGTITSIIGNSGCGKSTFLNLIAGILSRRYSGKIHIFGRRNTFRKKSIGFVPQEISIIPDLSIKDNIRIAGYNLGLSNIESLGKSSVILNILQLDEDLEKKPHQLSGGQKARLNLVLSILHDPEVIILDEPFVGLDFKNRRLLWHFLEAEKRKGKTVLLTSHLLSETQEHADDIIILKDAKIFFRGTVDKLKKKLDISYVMEMRFKEYNKEVRSLIFDCFRAKKIAVLDSYGRYMMISLRSDRTKAAVEKFFKDNDIAYQIVNYREPNLDEIFLKA